MILCLVRRPLDCGGVSGAIQMGNLQFTIYNLVSDNKTKFKTWLKPLIQVDKWKDYEIALINPKTYF